VVVSFMQNVYLYKNVNYQKRKDENSSLIKRANIFVIAFEQKILTLLGAGSDTKNCCHANH
jgi:hypothetical protein